MVVEGVNVALNRLGNVPFRVRVLLVLAGMLAAMIFGRFAWSSLDAYSMRLDEEIDMKTMELQRFSRILAEGDDYLGVHEDLLSLQENLIASRFVKGATPSLSEAMFQNIVNEWAEKSGLNILSLRVLPRTDREGVSVLRMVVNTRGEVGAIQNFIVALRQSTRFIFFEEVEIRTISRNERRYYYFNAQLAAWTIS